MKTLFSILTLFVPLKVELGWLSDIVAIERANLVGHASAFGSLCITIASVILAFKMLRMYYMIASDEQNGGFGGVSLKEIFRPLLIFFLLFNISPLMSLVDTSVNYVSAAASGIVSLDTNVDFSALKDDAGKTSRTESEELAEWRKQLQEAYKRNPEFMKALNDVVDLEKNLYTTQTRPFSTQSVEIRAGRSEDDIISEFFGNSYVLQSRLKDPAYHVKDDSGDERAFSENDDGALTAEQAELYRDAINKLNTMRDSYKEGVKDLNRADRRAKRGIGLVNKIVSLIFTLGGGLLLGFAEIMLAMFGMFAPLVLTLSLIDKWKDAFWGLLAKYFEISMWKPIALFMIHIITVARTTLNKEFANQIVAGALSVASGNAEEDAAMQQTINASGLAIGNIMICLIGIYSIFKVPSIATQVMNLGTGGAAGDMAGAGMAMGMAGAKLAGNAAKGTAKAGATVGVGAVSGAVAGAAGGGGLKGAIAGGRHGISGAFKTMGNTTLNAATNGNAQRMGVNMDNFSKNSERTKALARKYAVNNPKKPKGGGRK